MKFLSLELNGKKMRIVCAEVITFHDTFKADMVVEVDENETDLSGSYEDYKITGVNNDLSDFLLSDAIHESLYVDFNEGMGDWAKCYLQIDLEPFFKIDLEK